MKITGCDSRRKRLIAFFLQTFPRKLKKDLIVLKEIIITEQESFGSGHYHTNGVITISAGPNIWYFMEMLGHEIFHALEHSRSMELEHNLCDEFAKWLIYNSGRLKAQLEAEYGRRSVLVLYSLRSKIAKYAIFEEKKWEKSKLPAEAIKRYYNKHARFCR